MMSGIADEGSPLHDYFQGMPRTCPISFRWRLD